MPVFLTYSPFLQMALSLNELTTYLADYLSVFHFPLAESGRLAGSPDRVVHRLGLALDPPIAVEDLVRSQQLDAVWLHRPWRLDRTGLPPDFPVLFHHLPFDEKLTVGYNILLANQLLFGNLEEIGHKQAVDEQGRLLPHRPIGMLGNVPEQPFTAWVSSLRATFGGLDGAVPGQQDHIGRVAVVGAMNPILVQEAHERGATLYVTGEYRKGTQPTVDQTGMAVIAVGHHRSEVWGVQTLAGVIRQQCPGLMVYCLPE